MKFKRLKKLILILFIFLVFISAVLIYYIKGYIFNSPEACTVCHVMTEHYNSWKKSTHSKVTKCNDCHVVPEGNKYIAETKTGFWHTVNFLFDRYEKPIKIKNESYYIVIKNCYLCHADLIKPANFQEIHHKKPLPCNSCHSNMMPAPACTECHKKTGHNKIFY